MLEEMHKQIMTEVLESVNDLKNKKPWWEKIFEIQPYQGDDTEDFPKDIDETELKIPEAPTHKPEKKYPIKK